MMNRIQHPGRSLLLSRILSRRAVIKLNGLGMGIRLMEMDLDRDKHKHKHKGKGKEDTGDGEIISILKRGLVQVIITRIRGDTSSL